MSKVKNFFEIFQQVQGLHDIYTFIPEDEVMNFLKANPSLITSLREIGSKIKVHFPDSKLVLNMTEQTKEFKEPELVISIHPAITASKVLEKFSNFKEIWWSENYDRVRERISLNIEHPDFLTSGSPWYAIEDLVGTIEAPEDWALEHDHYLYDTPKLNKL